jgi:hypothetical protein
MNPHAKRCKAKAKSTGGQCKNMAVTGRNVCRIHGGASLSGIASPTFKHGRYSRDVAPEVLERYLAARDDPDLLALADEIALLDVRIGELVADTGGEKLTSTWAALGQAAARLRAAQASGEAVALAEAINALMMLAEEGGDIARKYYEMVAIIEQRRKLVETERKTREARKLYADAEDMMLIVTRLALLVREHVTDEDTLNAIARGIEGLLHPKARIHDLSGERWG